MGYPALHFDDENSDYDSNDTIGGRIIRARDAVGLSTSQLARRLGVKTQTLHNWETDRTEPRANRLTMLAGVLNVSPTWILVGRGESPTESDGIERSDHSQRGLLKLRESIQSKIDELNRILRELDDRIENRDEP